MNPAHWRVVVALALGFALGGCATVSPSTAPPPAERLAVNDPGAQVLDRLYFGRAIPKGGEVSDRDWAKFLAEVVTPRFPQGFTVLQVTGQWRGDDGKIWREPTAIIEVAHPDEAKSEQAIQEIANDYKQRFSQEAVLRIRQPAAVKFF